MDQFRQSLDFANRPIVQSLLKQIRRGIEKESLRITVSGFLSQNQHPIALGSTLTHPKITTDFSESLLEFITPTFNEIDVVLGELAAIHKFSYANLVNELLWTASMPCRLEGDDQIPIAAYGSSNIGQLKHVYRQGLAHRYGKTMQTIAGIHYNFSLPDEFWPVFQDFQKNKQTKKDFQSANYFALIRNFRRYVWLLMYLFGATPAVDASFVQKKPDYLKKLNHETYVAKYATSLRMSDLGYHNDAQSVLAICYNSLSDYTNTIQHAVQTPYPAYEAMGVQKDGHYLQLNTNILQIENEYYGSVRPKRNMQSGERPLTALKRDGVEYIEVRCLDLNPDLSLGIDAEQIKFMDIFLLYCLLKPSQEIVGSECEEITKNLTETLIQGRNPAVNLYRNTQKVRLTSWANELLEELSAIAELFDNAHGGSAYQAALRKQTEKVKHSELTPSGRQLAELVEKNQTFLEYGLEKSTAAQTEFLNNPLAVEDNEKFRQLARKSIENQQKIETSDTDSFPDFLKKYLTF